MRPSAYGITFDGERTHRGLTEGQALEIWERIVRDLPAADALRYRVTFNHRPARVYCDTKGRLTIREVTQ